jgi:hypothetical protein
MVFTPKIGASQVITRRMFQSALKNGPYRSHANVLADLAGTVEKWDLNRGHPLP